MGLKKTTLNLGQSCQYLRRNFNLYKKSKAIPVIGLAGTYWFDMSRHSHILDSKLTDGGEVITLTSRAAALYPPGRYWYSFL
jgi:hypothetical protein